MAKTTTPRKTRAKLPTIEVIPPTVKTPADLSRRFPAGDIARWGGGVVQSYAGDTSRVELDFDPRKPGFIWLKIGDKRACVHKDELIYFARFAKGSLDI